jgi:formate dehydrogenase assembly factor FdhD
MIMIFSMYIALILFDLGALQLLSHLQKIIVVSQDHFTFNAHTCMENDLYHDYYYSRGIIHEPSSSSSSSSSYHRTHYFSEQNQVFTWKMNDLQRKFEIADSCSKCAKLVGRL